MSKGWTRCAGGALLGLVATATIAAGQVVERERDTRLTGPRGRTIERDIKVRRGPGYVDRQVEIKRPGETIIRDTRIQGRPGGRPFGPGFGPGFGGPRFYGGPRFVENVIVPGPPIYSGFVGLPALSFFFGGPAAVPPPVVVAPGPVVVPPPSPPVPPAFDPFADALGRLKSFHASSRRDGALTLGRIGDPRAVPALNERLEHDFDKEVRVAAAHALGEIADERGAVALEKAALYDHRNDVREAAKLSLQKLPKPGEPPVSHVVAPASPTSIRSKGPVPPPIPNQPAVLDPGPDPRTTIDAPGFPNAEDVPPPPTPVPAGGAESKPILDRPNESKPGRDSHDG